MMVTGPAQRTPGGADASHQLPVLPTADDVPSVVGVDLSHTSFTKTFTGELEGSSVTQMLAARSPGGAGYVAMERIVGRLGDWVGTFVLLHMGTLDA